MGSKFCVESKNKPGVIRLSFKSGKRKGESNSKFFPSVKRESHFPPQIHGICSAWYGFREGGKCGYCKNTKDSKKCNIGATIQRVRCSLYDSMIQKQWVRCGTYFYQPQNRITCCPQYQNRLDVRNFRITAKYQKVLKKVNHWLKTGERRLPENCPGSVRKRGKRRFRTYDPELDEIITRVLLSMMEGGSISQIDNLSVTTTLNRKMKGVDHEKYQLCCGVIFQIIGLLKKSGGKEIKYINRFELSKSIADECNQFTHAQESSDTIFTEIKSHPSGYLHISLPSERFRLLQKKMHEEEETEGEEEEEQHKTRRDRIIEEGIDFELKPSEFVKEEFLLYQKFERIVHKQEERSEEDYFKFHIKTPLVRETMSNGPELQLLQGYGSFHYTYRLRKSRKLIAVSCLDVIPSGVYSLYFFHDPDYSFLELGKFSVFHEMNRLFEGTARNFPGFRYYYFGFYVHDCPKMNYKAQFKPQQVLCNVTWKYCDLDLVRKNVLSKTKFGRFFYEEEEEEKEIIVNNSRKNNMMILYENQLVQREIFSGLFGELTPPTVRKMDQFHREMGEWVNNIVYFCNKNDLVKYQPKERRRKHN